MLSRGFSCHLLDLFPFYPSILHGGSVPLTQTSSSQRWSRNTPAKSRESAQGYLQAMPWGRDLLSLQPLLLGFDSAGGSQRHSQALLSLWEFSGAGFHPGLIMRAEGLGEEVLSCCSDELGRAQQVVVETDPAGS